jgi:hypothetical protein
MRTNIESTHRRSLWFLVIAIAVLFGWGWMSWTSVPSLKASGDALKTIDALFTAINSRDSTRVALYRERLLKHASSGQLNPVAMVELSDCCEQATSGAWEDAAHRLYRIIEKQ